jgi:dienelactone hydrolase
MEQTAKTSFWLNTPTGFISASWYASSQTARESRLAVVIVPGIAQEDRTLSVGVSPLVDQLLDAGIPTLVAHLEGTSNSSSSLSDAAVADAWALDIEVAVEHVVKMGFQKVVVVGIKLSGLLALDALEHDHDEVDAVVMWAPALDGRKFVREAALLSVASGIPPAPPDSTETVLGSFEVSRDLLTTISKLRIDPARRRNGRVLIVDDKNRKDPRHEALFEKPESWYGDETNQWVNVPSDRARVPQHDITHITKWIANRAATMTSFAPREVAGSSVVRYERAGEIIAERFVDIGSHGLIGVCAQREGPAESQASSLAIALSPQPGRSFVELARDEAARGRVTLRFDLSSNGLSRRVRNEGWGELHSRSSGSEIRAALDWLEAHGERKIILVGFCAAAVASVRVAVSPFTRAIVAVNPALFVPGQSWRTFDGMTGSRLRKLIDKRDLHHFVERSRWHYRVEIVPPLAAVRRLMKKKADGVRVLLQFETTDVGFTYLKRIGGSALHRATDQITITSYEDLGHTLTGLPARARLFADLRAFINRQ